MIEKRCENCNCHFPSIENCTLDNEPHKVCLENNYKLFTPSEKAIRINEREEIILDIRKLLKDNSKTLSRESKMFTKAIIDLIKGRSRS